MLSYPPLSWSADDLPELLRPAIEKYRDEADELRRVPDELVGQLRANGAFRLNTPRELGGFELPLRTTMNVIERLARIDGPVAWVVWNLNVGFGAAFLDDASVQRIWGDGPDPLVAHSSQPGFLVESGDGFQLSGEWKLVSGIDSSDWVGLLGVVLDGAQPRMTEAGPDVRFCVLPRSAVTVHDTWHVTGMRGTNSNTVTAQDVHVAAEMTLRPTASPRIDRPLYRVPLMNQINSGGAAIVIGMAQAAIDEVLALSRTKTGPDGTPLERRPRVQAAIGEATAHVAAARALLLTTVGVLDAAAEANRPVTEAERGAVRGALCHAAATARAVLTSMYEVGSSTVLYESNRIGRLFRDGHTAAQHAILSAAGYEMVGRTVIGLPADDPFL